MGQFNVGFVLALIIGIIFLIFLFGGGGLALINIASVMGKISGVVWIIFGVFILIKLLFGKR